MKYLARHIAVWLFLFYGVTTNASHILGGEITYRHLKDQVYKVTLTIYRDCNGCKINGKGGGSSLDDCSEIDYIFVKGFDKTSSSETKFALNRESIQDITPGCRTKRSACQSNPSTGFGIEYQKFSAIIDLDDSKIKGFCSYSVYITLAERNSDITTGQASQNFCVDALINSCYNISNSSPEFALSPDFIVNGKKTQYQNFNALDKDNDSLVYSLVPALTAIDKDAKYNSGFSSTNPLTPYCITYPCSANKSNDPPLGFYFNQATGEAIFVPVNEGEKAVIAVKVEKYKKISGTWQLMGFIKRDIQLFIKTGEGNNTPRIDGKDYFEVCEGENFQLKIEATDKINSITSEQDTVSFYLNSSISNAYFAQERQSAAPFNYGWFSWTPGINSSNSGLYHFSISARDNACPLNAIGSKIITIKVLPKESFTLKYVDLSCGNFEISSSKLNPKSKLTVQLFTLDGATELFKSTQVLDTVSYLPEGDYILLGTLINENGCTTLYTDTIFNRPINTMTLLGDSSVCPNIANDYLIVNIFNKKALINWYFDSASLFGKNTSLNHSFDKDGKLRAEVSYAKGKWYCLNSLTKNIKIKNITPIQGPDTVRICHNSGLYDLSTVNLSPKGGLWSSNSIYFSNGIINSTGSDLYYNDTLSVEYEINAGCKISKTVQLILESIPSFELTTTSICEMSTPVRFAHLVIRPYDPLKYTFKWDLKLSPQDIKYDNGFAVVYPSDLGYGEHVYYGEVTGVNGCKNYDTATLEITPAVQIKFENEVILCQGSQPEDINIISGVKPAGGNWSFYDFELFKNRHFVLSDSCGTYEVTYIYDNYGCYDSKKVNITIVCQPPITTSVIPSKLCDTELPLALQGTPAGGFWDGNHIKNNFFSPPKSNKIIEYTIAYKLAKDQCQFKKESKIRIIPSPEIQVSLNKLNFCKEEEILLLGSIKHATSFETEYNKQVLSESIQDSIFLNNKFTHFTRLNSIDPQPYSIRAINNDGCFAKQEYFIYVADKPEIINLRDTTVCEETDYKLNPGILFQGNEQLIYKWTESLTELSNLKNLDLHKLSAGKHILNFNVSHSYCGTSKNIELTVLPKPVVDFQIQPGEVTSITRPEFWFLNRSEPNLSWLWNFGDKPTSTSFEESPKYSYSDTGTFLVSLTGTNNKGCAAKVSKTLYVKPDVLVFIPNAFSPNHKDVEANNVFSVSVNNYTSFSMEIFDRWGHIVYKSKNASESWDGKSGEVVCTPDVYFYSIKVNSLTGHWYYYRGTISLIR
jgi:gliding motility-associated-like protein